MTTNNAVNTTLSGQTGTGTFVGSTSPTLVTPVLGVASATSVKLTAASNVLLDSNNNNMVAFAPTASAVNFLAFTNNTTGSGPVVSAVGSDTNIGLVLSGKGNLGANVQGDTSGGNALTGYVGEVITNVGSGVSLTSGVSANVTSISLTAGDWDVSGLVLTAPAATTTTSYVLCSASTVSATLQNFCTGGVYAANQSAGIPTPYIRVSSASSTTIYLVIDAFFAISTMTASGYLSARRMR